jgi:hypothetical protein
MDFSVEHVVTCITASPLPIYVQIAVHRVKFANDVSQSHTKLAVVHLKTIRCAHASSHVIVKRIEEPENCEGKLQGHS